MAVETFPLKLGSIDFSAPFESPNGHHEGLGDLGSEMMSVVKRFPGGIMTAQLMGSVPKPIPIKGILFGQNARSRSMELQRLVDDGEQLTLTYAEFKFEGFAKDYKPFVKSPYEIWFELLFIPLLNRSTYTSGVADAPSSDPFAPVVGNALNTMNQQSTAPANGYQMPSTVQQGVSNLNNAVKQQLQANGGAVSTLPLSTQQSLQSQVAGVLSTLQPLVNGTDPVAAAAAAELTSTLSILKQAFTANLSTQNLDTFKAINPNLYQVASFYYGDPTLWQQIADATNNAAFDQAVIVDPLPLGTYSLIVPPNSVVNLNPPATVMSDGLSQVA